MSITKMCAQNHFSKRFKWFWQMLANTKGFFRKPSSIKKELHCNFRRADETFLQQGLRAWVQIYTVPGGHLKECLRISSVSIEDCMFSAISIMSSTTKTLTFLPRLFNGITFDSTNLCLSSESKVYLKRVGWVE